MGPISDRQQRLEAHQAFAPLVQGDVVELQYRVEDDMLNLTQEFLAQMLGTQRTTVVMVAGALQRSGLIEYKRGRVKIVRREDLESAACECYGVAHRLLANLYRDKTVEDSSC